MDGKLTGGCQCGAIRYEIAGPPGRVVACHCADCQRQSGSAFGMTLVVKEENFRLTEGDLKFFLSRSDAGRKRQGAFCPNCGVRIHHKLDWRPGMLSVKPGTLDDTAWLKPEMHMWTARKLAWVAIPDGTEAYESQPS